MKGLTTVSALCQNEISSAITNFAIFIVLRSSEERRIWVKPGRIQTNSGKRQEMVKWTIFKVQRTAKVQFLSTYKPTQALYKRRIYKSSSRLSWSREKFILY